MRGRVHPAPAPLLAALMPNGSPTPVSHEQVVAPATSGNGQGGEGAERSSAVSLDDNETEEERRDGRHNLPPISGRFLSVDASQHMHSAASHSRPEPRGASPPLNGAAKSAILPEVCVTNAVGNTSSHHDPPDDSLISKLRTSTPRRGTIFRSASSGESTPQESLAGSNASSVSTDGSWTAKRNWKKVDKSRALISTKRNRPRLEDSTTDRARWIVKVEQQQGKIDSQLQKTISMNGSTRPDTGARQNASSMHTDASANSVKLRKIDSVDMFGADGRAGLDATLHNIYVIEGRSPDGGKTVIDHRTDVDKLTDYLMLLACPSEAEKLGLQTGRLSSSPLKDSMHYHNSWLQVYEEGFGGQNGCEPEYWSQHFVAETPADPAQVGVKMDGENGGTNNTSVAPPLLVWRTPDNQVHHNLQLRVREFFDLGGYRAFPDVVTVEVKIREILTVDASKGIFRAIFIMTTRWFDPHFDSPSYADRKGTSVYARSIPHVTLDGVDEGNFPVGLPANASTLDQNEKHCGMVTLQKGSDPPGVLYKSHRLQCTFLNNTASLVMFPFDKQMLTMTIRMWGASEAGDVDHGRVLLPISVNVELMTGHPDWIVMSAMAESRMPRNGRQEMVVILPLRRKPMYFVFNVLVIIGLLTTMAFCSFLISNDTADFEARCQITLTLTLTIVAYKFLVGEKFPSCSYLTMMDVYIYSGILTAGSIFVLNSFTVCVDVGECENETASETIWFWVIVGFWAITNILIFSTAVRYTFKTYIEERHLHAFCVADPEDFHRKSDRVAQIIERAKHSERFFEEGEDTVVKRRRNALDRLAAMEAEQRDIAQEERTVLRALHSCRPSEQRSLDRKLARCRKNPDILRNYNNKATDGAAIESRWRQYKLFQPESRDAIGQMHVTDGISTLLARAGLAREIPVLGPVLDIAGLTPTRLNDLLGNGCGMALINSLLEDAGVMSQNQRVDILGALNPSAQVQRMLQAHNQEETTKTKSSRGDVTFLVLQGSGSYLWEDDLGLKGMQPLPLADVLNRIDIKLNELQKCSVMGYAQLRSTANCLFARMLLRTPLLSQTTYVYARREVTEAKRRTQTWAGYLALVEKGNGGTVWDASMGDAVAVEVGTERSVRGIARRIRIAQPHESSIAGSSEHAALEYTELPLPKDGACAIQVGKRLTASILYAHPYLLSDRTQAHASIPVVAQLRQTLESLGIPLPHDRTPVQRVGCKPVARTEMSDPSAVDRATRASTSPTTCDVDGIGSPLNGDDRSGSVGTAAGTASRTLRSDGNCNGTDGMVSTAQDDFDVNATQTDRMWQLCDTMLSHCIEDLLDSHPTVSHILLLATAELRDRLGLLQLHCGTITSEHLSAVAEFVQALIALRHPDRTPTVKVQFKVLSVEEEARCNHTAACDGLQHIDPSGDSVLADLLHALHDEGGDGGGAVNTIAWSDQLAGDGSCHGVFGQVQNPTGTSFARNSALEPPPPPHLYHVYRDLRESDVNSSDCEGLRLGRSLLWSWCLIPLQEVLAVPIGLKQVITRLHHEAAKQRHHKSCVDSGASNPIVSTSTAAPSSPSDTRPRIHPRVKARGFDEARGVAAVDAMRRAPESTITFTDVGRGVATVQRRIAAVLKELRFDLEPIGLDD
eukprot:m.365252 g.365252  ORF g.365252 m.365252 type:complete len:1630 (-) comp28083_c1_seq2:403-5292(-)